MTNEERKVFELALEALQMLHDENMDYLTRNKLGGENNQCMVFARETITAIKEALAQPEQEPVGKFAKFTDGIWREVTDGSAGVPLYTTPPQRTWVGLTDEDRAEILNRKWWNFEDEFDVDGFLRLAEAKLKDKNI